MTHRGGAAGPHNRPWIARLRPRTSKRVDMVSCNPHDASPAVAFVGTGHPTRKHPVPVAPGPACAVPTRDARTCPAASFRTGPSNWAPGWAATRLPSGLPCWSRSRPPPPCPPRTAWSGMGAGNCGERRIGSSESRAAVWPPPLGWWARSSCSKQKGTCRPPVSRCPTESGAMASSPRLKARLARAVGTCHCSLLPSSARASAASSDRNHVMPSAWSVRRFQVRMRCPRGRGHPWLSVVSSVLQAAMVVVS